MRTSGLSFDVRRCAKPIAQAMVVLVLVWSAAVLPTVLELLPPATQEAIAAGLVWTLLALYWAALVPAFVGGVILAIAWIRARRAGTRRPIIARLLLGCLSCLFAVSLIEAGSAVWLGWEHRFPTLPTRFAEPSDDDLKITVIGGSSAWGQPYDRWLSIGPIVAWKLRQALPGRRIDTEVLAKAGATLEEMHQKLAMIRCRPDVLVVYAGHNEFQARFPWDQDPDRAQGALPYVLEFVMQDRLGSPFSRLLSEVLRKYRLMAPPRLIDRGPIEPPIVRRDESDRILDGFGRRLEAIVSWCDRVGVMPVLVIPGDNESGFEPNRSTLPNAVTQEERLLFARDWLAARGHESDAGPAMARYRALIARQPGFAEAHFRLARLLEHSGRYAEAATDYRQSRDLDGFPQRCTTPFQNAYRRVAARHGCILIDGPEELERISPNHIVGDLMMNDGHHPSLRGQIALAEAVLRELRGRVAFGWSQGAAPSIDAKECATHFGMNTMDWSTVCLKAAAFYRITAVIRYDRSERLTKASLYERAAEQIAAGKRPSELGVPGIGLAQSPPAAENRNDQADSSDPTAGASGRIGPAAISGPTL